MKCKYGSIWLTGTPWQEDCGELTWDASQPVELLDLVRAVTPYIDAQGNLAESLPVPVTLNLGSELQVLDYIAKLPWLLPTKGELRFEETRGLYTWRCIYPDAAWVSCRRVRKGESLDVVYQFVVTGPPETSLYLSNPNTLITEDGDALIIETGETLVTE